jgi:hypothetical protein
MNHAEIVKAPATSLVRAEWTVAKSAMNRNIKSDTHTTTAKFRPSTIWTPQATVILPDS